jgi:hypothetical protein
MSPQHQEESKSPLAGPPINPQFARALDDLVGVARRGQRPDCEVFNPSDRWLIDHMPIFQELPQDRQREILQEVQELQKEAEAVNAQGRAATRVWPEAVVRLDNGGLDFFSQLGVVRRPDLTQYFIDGFRKNRDALAFSEENQALFAEVFQHITRYMERCFAAGESIVQTDRQVGDAPGRSFHARQLLFGVRYLQCPYMWRQLTFDLPRPQFQEAPDILEVSIPSWLEDLGLPEDLKARIREAGLTQLIFKAPTRGLSLHLGFDYVGEHKMGPLSIAMFLVKQNNGLAVQAALSLARARTLSGALKNTALVTIGPSLHGKSTLTIMIELAGSDLAQLLNLSTDPQEGVCPMNDDIVLLQPLGQVIDTNREGHRLRISHGIDGTENNFYAVPTGLTREDDPITYDVVRGTPQEPNSQETLENVPVNLEDFTPNYMENPVRNMRMILSRPRLLARKGTQHLLEGITDGRVTDAVHVPMECTDQVFFQAVMRQNTVVPPLRRLTLEQYIRVLMYGEAVQMGAATGAIGRPYVEYFSDPFIIGLEDENANLMLHILRQMERGGLPLSYYVFNTGGVGADTNDQATGANYKKIPRDLTLMLQEALLREAVKFQYDATMRADVAIAIVDAKGNEVLDLRQDWLPINIYGEDEYTRRVVDLRRRRYYGRDAQDKAGILRYTKVTDALIDLNDIPDPQNEREMAWLLSFYWKVDQCYDTLTDLAGHVREGYRPMPHLLRELKKMYESGLRKGLSLPAASRSALQPLGIG